MKKYLRGSLSDRFMNRVVFEPMSGCWLWGGGLTGDYGAMKTSTGVAERAHRVSWRLFRGEIPEALSVLHRCDNPPCVNPDHLFLGTRADNVADKTAKGRQSRGTRNPHVLSESDVYAIRALGSSETNRAIGERFGIGKSTVQAILAGKKWAHLSGGQCTVEHAPGKQ